MIVCPQCNTENPPDAQICRQCGEPLPASGPAATLTHSAVTAEPPPTDTQPVPAIPFGPRPEGAIFGNRFLMTRLEFSNGQIQRYAVVETGVPDSERIRQCSNCGAVHGHPETYCTQCSEPLSANYPALTLSEAQSRERFGLAYDLAGQGLAHGSLRIPVAAFEEKLGASPRFCVVAPAVQPLPESPERAQVLDWAGGLVDGLVYLHSVGLTFGGQIDRSLFALADGRAVWADLSRVATVQPDQVGQTQAADVRALAQVLYTWITGQSRLVTDATLGALNDVFATALGSPGYAMAEDLAEDMRQAREQVARRPSRDYRTGRRTDVGMVRSLNEDSLLTIELVRVQQSVAHPIGVYAVADGMGGHAAGEVASGTIVNTIAQLATSTLVAANSSGNRLDYEAWLRDAVNAAAKAVFELRKSAGTDMGSTLVLAVVDGMNAYLAHVGDSRIYLINRDGLRRVTIDHSLVERLVATGQITAAEARSHPQRSVIYKTVGDKPRVEPDISVHALAPGDRLLLCSDGLNTMVEDERMAQILARNPNPQAACDELVKAACAAGGEDNVTAVIVEVVEPPPLGKAPA